MAYNCFPTMMACDRKSFPVFRTWLTVILELTCLMVGGGAIASAWDDMSATSPSALLNTPHHVLENAALRVVVALPSQAAGFYRGRRFEGGLVAHVSNAKHTFVGTTDSDGRPIGSLGLCAEFIEPIVLPVAGESPKAKIRRLVRIGVGLFDAPSSEGRKPTDLKPLQFFDWQVENSDRSIHMVQDVQLAPGFGYHLEKTISIAPQAPEIYIKWYLKNSGKLPITTRHYSHNWLMLDGETRSSSLRLQTTFDYIGFVKGFIGANGFRMRPRELIFLEHAMDRPDVASFLTTTEINGSNRARLVKDSTGISVEIANDWTPFRFVTYVDARGFCPEFHIGIQLGSGEETSWCSTYSFRSSLK